MNYSLLKQENDYLRSRFELFQFLTDFSNDSLIKKLFLFREILTVSKIIEAKLFLKK